MSDNVLKVIIVAVVLVGLMAFCWTMIGPESLPTDAPDFKNIKNNFSL